MTGRWRFAALGVPLLAALLCGCEPDPTIDGSSETTFRASVRQLNDALEGSARQLAFRKAIEEAVRTASRESVQRFDVRTQAADAAQWMGTRYRELLDGLTAEEAIARFRPRAERGS